MPSARFAAAEALVATGVREAMYPGAQIVVGDAGEVVWRHAVGLTARVPGPGTPVTLATWFDVASLTKIVATTAVTARLVAAGQLDLHAPLAWPPGAPYTARHLLEHSAGLVWWRPFHERLTAASLAPAAARAEIVRLAAAEPLEAAPGTRAVYSDLSYLLLGALCERLGGARLDALAERLVFGPLGLAQTRFVPLDEAWRPSPVAATELCPRRGLLAGEVHDDNAHAAGGVVGHAGVFSTADDLGRFAAAWSAAWHGDARVFSPAVVRAFSTRSAVSGSTRALGWDTPSPGAGSSQAGDRWPRGPNGGAIGHGGFTGCSMWLDLPRRRWVVFLTNRVHPSRTDDRIKRLRPRLHDAIVAALDAR